MAELLSGRPSAYPSSSLPATPEGRRRQGPAPGQVPVVRSEAALPWATRGNPAAEEAPGGAGGRSVPEPAPSRTHGLDTTPFDALDPASLELLAARLKESRKWPRRRTRRGIPGQPGRIDLRRTAAAWCRTAGEPLHMARVRPRLDRRRLVVLCDVSESMRPYAAAYLHLMRAVSAQGGETFAFATRLTRLSPVLARHSPEVAVELASRRVADRFGGTRIASSLRDLLGSHHGEVLRGAICVIASDGWDTDPPDQLAHELGRLARRAHRVVWLNPRAGESGYEPLVAGMAAALPYCDAFVPARTFADLSRGLDAIVGERARVSSRASRRRRDGSV
ncbi:MAG: VWA domain-containing protein [Nocardioides sp.]|nr:VWA domain-containing protein [Nocardioides sp.]